MDFDWNETEQAFLAAVGRAIDGLADPDGPEGLAELAAAVGGRLGPAGYWDAGNRLGGVTGPVRLAADAAIAGAAPGVARCLQAARHARTTSRTPAERQAGPISLLLPAEAGAAVEAVRDRGEIVCTGATGLAANAPLADRALALATLDGQPVLLLAGRDEAGVTVEPAPAGAGLTAVIHGRLLFDRARLPAERVIGPADPVRLRAEDHLLLAALSTGLMRGTLARFQAWAPAQVRSGRPLLASQQLRYRLAELLAQIQAAELLLYRSGWLLDTGDPEGVPIARVARAFCAEAAVQVTGALVEAAGAEAYTPGDPFEKAARDARQLALLGTPVPAARLAVAADLLAESERKG